MGREKTNLDLDGDTMGGDDGVCAPGGCDLRGRGLAGRKEIKK
jgi:hypothetical protein